MPKNLPTDQVVAGSSPAAPTNNLDIFGCDTELKIGVPVEVVIHDREGNYVRVQRVLPVRRATAVEFEKAEGWPAGSSDHEYFYAITTD